MKNKIKILQLVKSLGVGGAEMLLAETLKAHDRDRFEFHYIYFLPFKNQMVESLEQSGAKVTCFSANNNLGILTQTSKLKKYCLEHNIEIIHAHLPWAGIVARIVGKLTKIPVIYTEHNSFDIYHPLTQFFSALNYKWQNRVLAVSQASKLSLEKRNLFKDIIYVPNGVNTALFSKSAGSTVSELKDFIENKVVIGTVAVFRKQKRLDIMVEVAKLSAEKELPFSFLIVGDGVEMNSIKAKVEEYHLQNIYFAGLHKNPVELMNTMDAFLITSDYEGLPVALLESMSMGIVPFCTPVGGIPNVVKDNFNGVLLPSNQPEIILEQLKKKVLYDKVHYEEMKREARNTIIEGYSIERMVNQLESIYNEVLNERN
jgi:glycosyltransferase involved in cell wall biosynthesis